MRTTSGIGSSVVHATNGASRVTVKVSITKRKRRRRMRTGALVTHTRFVVNFREPRSGRRKQFFFTQYQDAVAKREAVVSGLATHRCNESADLTIAQAMSYWLEARRREVKAATWNSYQQISAYIVGPLLVRTRH